MSLVFGEWVICKLEVERMVSCNNESTVGWDLFEGIGFSYSRETESM